LTNIKLYIALLGVAAFTGCNLIDGNTEETSEPLARVYNTYLYEDDVLPFISKGLTPEDSLMLVQNIIYKWGKEQLLLNKAEFNLPEDVSEIEVLVGNYRNDLIKFAYQQEYIDNHLDTLISIEEIREYYKENPQNFELKENILKAEYYIFPADLPDLKFAKKWFASNNKTYKSKFDELAQHYSLVSVTTDTSWISFEEVVKIVPLKTYNQQEFLAKNRKVILEDSTHLYCLNITSFKIKDDVSPLPYVRETIRSIILNQRKLDLLKKMEEEIYNDAYEKKDFEIY